MAMLKFTLPLLLAAGIPAATAGPPDALSARPMALRAMAEIRRERPALLAQTPISVTFDKRLPSPAGDPRDFTSCGPYWWPDPARPDGLPYIRRDGEFNPDFQYYDQTKLNLLCYRATAGALLWHFDRDREAAGKTAELLKVFFLDAATRMNPQMKYAQAIPGRVSGRAEGAIDTTIFADLVKILPLLENAPGMTPELNRGLKEWFRTYGDWLLNDPMARENFGVSHNIGLSYHAQIIAYARFCGNPELERKHLEIMRGLLVQAVDANGFLPAEITRTRSWHYSAFALRMAFRAVDSGHSAGIDLLDIRTPAGRALRRAIDRLLFYPLHPEEKWPYPQPGGAIDAATLGDIVIQYASDTGSAEALAVLKTIPEEAIAPVNRIRFAPAEIPTESSRKEVSR